MIHMIKKKNRKINKKSLNLNKITDLFNNIKNINLKKDFTDSDEFTSVTEIAMNYDLLSNSEKHKKIVSKFRKFYGNLDNYSKTEHFSNVKTEDEIFKENHSLQEDCKKFIKEFFKFDAGLVQKDIKNYQIIRIPYKSGEIAEYHIDNKKNENMYLVMMVSCSKSDITFSDIGKKVSKMPDREFIIFKVKNSTLKLLTNNNQKKERFFVYHLVIEVNGDYIISDPFSTITNSQFVRGRGPLEVEVTNPENGVKTKITKKAKKENSTIVIPYILKLFCESFPKDKKPKIKKSKCITKNGKKLEIKELESENSESEESERKKLKVDGLESNLIQKYKNGMIDEETGELKNRMSIKINYYDSNNYRNSFSSNESIFEKYDNDNRVASSFNIESLYNINKDIDMFYPQSLSSVRLDNDNLPPVDSSQINDLGKIDFLPLQELIPQFPQDESVINSLNNENITTNNRINQSILTTSFQDNGNLPPVDSSKINDLGKINSLSSQELISQFPQNVNMINLLNSESITTNNQNQSILTTSFQDNGNLPLVDSSQFNDLGKFNSLSSQELISQFPQDESVINSLNNEDITNNNRINQSLLTTSFQDNGNLPPVDSSQINDFEKINSLSLQGIIPQFPQNVNMINFLNNVNNTNYGQTHSLFSTSCQGHNNFQQGIYNKNNKINLLLSLLLTAQLQDPLNANIMCNYLIKNIVNQLPSFPYQSILNESNMLNILNNGNSVSNGSDYIPFLPFPFHTDEK